MTWLVWQVRTWFCKHEWDHKEATCRHTRATTLTGVKVSATCKKCGWHRSYWKYL